MGSKEEIIPVTVTFVTQDLTNWTLSDPITRVTLRVGVAYGADVNKVQDILTQVARKNERVVSDPTPEVFCVGLGDSSIDFEVWVYVKDLMDIMPLSDEIHASITSALTDAAIEIPFPQRDIHVRTLAGGTKHRAKGTSKSVSGRHTRHRAHVYGLFVGFQALEPSCKPAFPFNRVVCILGAACQHSCSRLPELRARAPSPGGMANKT